MVTKAHKSHCLVGSSKESGTELYSLVLQASYMGENVWSRLGIGGREVYLIFGFFVYLYPASSQTRVKTDKESRVVSREGRIVGGNQMKSWLSDTYVVRSYRILKRRAVVLALSFRQRDKSSITKFPVFIKLHCITCWEKTYFNGTETWDEILPWFSFKCWSGLVISTRNTSGTS